MSRCATRAGLLTLTAVLSVGIGGLPAASAATASAKTIVVTAVPRMPHTVSPATIEADPAYVPQTSCDPVAKKGVLKFRTLVMATYAKFGAQDWGIGVSCAAEGMTSEHSDGRAWDFALNSRVPKQKAAADRFLHWLFDPDAAGNEQANARRFGVMYVIYNDRIRMVGGDWRPYDPDTCGPTVKKRNATLCHENHIHLSFTWNGALAKTTAWTGAVSATDYGPCVPAGKKHAPKRTKPNLTPCPGTRGGGSGGGGTRPPVTLPTLPTDPITDPVLDPVTCLVTTLLTDGTVVCNDDGSEDFPDGSDTGTTDTGANNDQTYAGPGGWSHGH